MDSKEGMMKLNRTRLFLIISGLMIVTLACSLFGGESASGGNGDKYLGDEYRSEGGGFSIRQAKDYDFKDVIGIVNMVAPGGNDKTGPGVIVMGGVTIEGTTNESLIDKITGDSGDMKVGKPQSVKVAGVDGLTADITGSYEGTEIKGKVAVAMVTDEQQFTIMGFSPADKWKEISPVYDAVLGSVKFFDADPNFGLEPEQQPEDQPQEAAEATEVTSAGIESEKAPEFEIPTARPGEIRQWAISARASSQYGNPDWAASQATGEPDVIDCGDNTSAWASYNSDTIEWIELTYEIPVTPTEINIFQNYNPSQVVEVQMTATDGKKYTAWEGYPETTEYCPDQMTITIDLTKKIKVNKLRITIDQRVNGWGWDEIDAVELVGISDTAGSSAPAATPKASSSTSNSSSLASGKPVPTNYSGWMAGKNYQGFVGVVINKTKEKDLDGLIGMKGKKSTENFKPRVDHKDTYIYEFPDGMRAFISVLTNGQVYKKSISGSYPKDFKLETVTKANYDKLNAVFKKESVINYVDMANLLKSPGFLRESYFADEKTKSLYEWYAPNGDRISGFFLDGRLTGMAGLVYIPAEN